jgi:hypothetical protein
MDKIIRLFSVRGGVILDDMCLYSYSEISELLGGQGFLLKGTSIYLFRTPTAVLVPMNRDRNPHVLCVLSGFGVYPDIVGTSSALHS